VYSHTTVIVNWHGPFTKEDVKARADWKNGLYLASGILKYKRTNEIQYSGMTKRSFWQRINNNRHNVYQIAREMRFWLGNVVYPDEASRHHLEIAEAIIIYFWQPALNERTKGREPTHLSPSH
jgi:hypothetical protein